MPDLLQSSPIRIPIVISLGAIAGALSRYYLTVWITQRFGTSFPYATFMINLTGCFLMGFFLTLISERTAIVSPEVRLLVAVGFLGSYTTFSTYGFESLVLLRDRLELKGLFYWLGSATVGVISVQLGITIAKLFK